MKTHFSCVVIYRTSEANGDLEFLVIDSRSRAMGLQVKFPGGSNVLGESAEMTRDRVTYEMTGLAFLKSKQIWEKQEAGGHTRHGYLVNDGDCSGSVRSVIIFEGDAELDPPRWVPVENLPRVLDFSYHEAFLAALQEIGIFSKDVKPK